MHDLYLPDARCVVDMMTRTICCLHICMYVSKMASFKGPKTPLLVDVKPEAQGVNAQFQICTGQAWGHTTTALAS